MMDENTINIRPMRLGDLDAVLHIDQLSFSMPWPKSAYRYELEKNKGSMLWVADEIRAQEHGKVVGMIAVWMILDEAHIATLAVHPDFRGRGIGSRLLEFGLIEAQRRGARKARLEVRAGNQIAQTLYEGFGFEVVYRRPRYYRDNNEDALLMNLGNLDGFVERNHRRFLVSRRPKP